MKRLSLSYVVFPALAVWSAWPVIASLPPFHWPNFDRFTLLVGAPIWLGCLSAPGYLYAWAGRYHYVELTPALRIWVGASLVGALVASAVGALVSVPVALPVPFALAAAACSLLLLLKFLRSR